MELVEEIDHLLVKKRELMDANADLRPYKMNYDTLKDTFDLPPEKRPKRGFRRPILATKKVAKHGFLVVDSLVSNLDTATSRSRI